jgi:hypothetical protein
LIIHLIPLRKGSSGSYVVNTRHLGIDNLPEAYRVNATHLVENLGYYVRERDPNMRYALSSVACP